LWQLTVSHDGTRVAIAFGENTLVSQIRIYYIEIYDLMDGNLLARLPVNGIEGIAVSPDGQFIAVGQREVLDSATDNIQPTVHVFEIATGRKLATMIHDNLRLGRGEYSYAAFGPDGIRFTADGRYLLTSTIHTKIWSLNRISR